MDSHWKQTVVRFLTARTISLFGSSLVRYAIVWYVTLSTPSGRMLTISTICGSVLQIIIPLFAGVWIDRYDRKKLIMVPDAVIALATLVLVAAFLSGYREIRLLFTVFFVRSAGTGTQTLAVNVVIPQIVPLRHLMRANGIQNTLASLMMFLSPAASGAILSVAGPEATLLIDVATALIGVGVTSTLTVPMYRRNTVEGSAQVDSLEGGFRYLCPNTLVYRLLMFQIVILFPISPSTFLTPLMVSRTFGPQVWRLIAPEMTHSIGTVLGGFLTTSWGGFKKRLNTTLMAGAAYGILMLGLGIASAFWAYLALSTVIGITASCCQSPVIVSIQERVEPSMQERVFSFM